MSVYHSVLERFLMPAWYAAHGRKYGRNRALLDKSQWWSSDELMAFQWKETAALLDHVFATVPWYREKYRAAGIERGDIRGLEDVKKLPVLTRDELNAHREDLKSTTYKGRLLSHATGGSSGVPARFYITIESYDWRIAATHRVYGWTGCSLGERSLYLWGAPIGKVPRLKQVKLQMYRSFQRQLVFSTFSQTEESWMEIYRAALRFRPLLVVGYVSSTEQFCRFLLDKKLRIPGVKAVVAAAEPVFQPFRDIVREALDAPVFNTYGSREFMSIGGECEHHSGIHLNAENLLIETESPASAEPSPILVTDLHNYGMPFIRYEIGDVGVFAGGRCPCGRGLPRLRSVDGRVLDTLRTADGRTVPGELFPHLLKDIPEIREFQVQQLSPTEIVIRAVLSSDMSDKSRNLIAAESTLR